MMMVVMMMYHVSECTGISITLMAVITVKKYYEHLTG